MLTAEAGANIGFVKEKGKTKSEADAGAGLFGLGPDIGFILPF